MSSPEATGQINSSLCTSMQPKNCASRKENDSFLRSCMMKNLKKPRGKTMYGYGYCWVYHHSSNRRVAVSQGKSSPQWLGDHGCWICGEVTMRKRLHGCWCLVGNGWECGNGTILNSYYGSFPHSLLSTSKQTTSTLAVSQVT